MLRKFRRVSPPARQVTTGTHFSGIRKAWKANTSAVASASQIAATYYQNDVITF